MSGLTLRRATEADRPFMCEVLRTAADWQGVAAADSLLEPRVAAYLDHWKPHLPGFIAERTNPMGAAWLTAFPEESPGYGFVDASVPELTIGVLGPYRRQGVGRTMLSAVVYAAYELGLSALSLSVAASNPAVALYRQLGFEVHGPETDHVTMILRLVGD